MIKNPIKFVYFDVGMILYTYPHIMDEKKDVPGGWEQAFINELISSDRELCLGEMTLLDLWQSFYQKHNLKSSLMENPIEYLCQYHQPRKEMHMLVDQLRQRYQVGLLTNMYVDFLPKLIEIKTVPPREWFSAIVDSSVVHAVKPDREIYGVAMKQAGVKPSEIAFVDDRLENVEAAQKHGWTTWHFNLENPDVTIKEMTTALLE